MHQFFMTFLEKVHICKVSIEGQCVWSDNYFSDPLKWIQEYNICLIFLTLSQICWDLDFWHGMQIYKPKYNHFSHSWLVPLYWHWRHFLPNITAMTSETIKPPSPFSLGKYIPSQNPSLDIHYLSMQWFGKVGKYAKNAFRSSSIQVQLNQQHHRHGIQCPKTTGNMPKMCWDPLPIKSNFTNCFSNLSVFGIQKLIDQSLSDMSKPWMGKLTFPWHKWCCWIDHIKKFCNLQKKWILFNTTMEQVTVSASCIFAHKIFLLHSTKVDSVIVLGGLICRGNWRNLCQNVEILQYVMVGAKINQERLSSLSSVYIYCYCEARESNAKEVTESNPYGTTTLINDKKNSKGKDGKNRPKQVKMTCKKNVCKFLFSVKSD